MAAENESYQCVYNVGLLDDLHNYFPAFLYDSGRFQTPAQMFHYLRTQINEHFNLPARGARLAGFSPGSRTAEVPVPAAAPPRVTRRFDQAAAAALVGLLDLSGSFLGENSYFFSAGIPGSQGIPFMEPVTVRPSEEVISRNTRVQPGSDCPHGSVCAICQDSIQDNDVCRALSTCHHVYHKTCIDQWFLSNVQCPTCRRDIRDTPAELQEPSAPPSVE
jgi:hypothetical protein